jgi:RNA polymerase sigma factor (sigma-70 family)
MTASAREADWAMWMRAAIAGDAEAYRRFLASIAPHVRAVACSRGRTLGAAGNEIEDIVQEVLLAIHLKRGTWDETRPIGPWISAITRNKLIDILRRNGRHASIPIEHVMDSLPAEDHTPELSARDIETLLGQLKQQQREIVRSISLNGKSIGETAARLHMSEGAVRVALHRALKALGGLYRSTIRED